MNSNWECQFAQLRKNTAQFPRHWGYPTVLRTILHDFVGAFLKHFLKESTGVERSPGWNKIALDSTLNSPKSFGPYPSFTIINSFKYLNVECSIAWLIVIRSISFCLPLLRYQGPHTPECRCMSIMGVFNIVFFPVCPILECSLTPQLVTKNIFFHIDLFFCLYDKITTNVSIYVRVQKFPF